MTQRPSRLLLVLPLLFLAGQATGADEEKKPPPVKFKLDRLDPRFDMLIDPDAKLEELAHGFAWTEGPVWIAGPQGKGYLLFSDIPNNRVVKWEEGKGISDFLK